MTRQITNFVTRRFRSGITPEEAQRYNRQVVFALQQHELRGHPIGVAAKMYGVAPEDMLAMRTIVLKYDPREIRARLLAEGKIVPAELLRQLIAGGEIDASQTVRPSCRKVKATALFPEDGARRMVMSEAFGINWN